MSQLDRQIRRANLLLAAELGSLDGVHPIFQWQWSESLITLIPALDDAGDPIFDFLCACGTNKQIHEASCKGSAAKMRFERYAIAPNIHNRWLLGRWIPPPPSDKWAEMFGALGDYPVNGTYVPLASNDQQIVLKAGMIPDEPTTWTVIHTVKSAKTVEQLRREYDETIQLREAGAIFSPSGEVISRPPPNAPWWQTHDRLKDAMTTYGQIPGSRDSHVSYPKHEPDAKIKRELTSKGPIQ